jgi:hypothetical protein
MKFFRAAELEEPVQRLFRLDDQFTVQLRLQIRQAPGLPGPGTDPPADSAVSATDSEQ